MNLIDALLLLFSLVVIWDQTVCHKSKAARDYDKKHPCVRRLDLTP